MLFQDHRTWMSTHLIQYKGQYWVVQGCLAMQYSWICHLSNVKVNYVCFSFECIRLPHSSFRCWHQYRENAIVQSVTATPYCQSPPSDETRWLYHLHHRAHQSPRYWHKYFNRISVLDGIFSCSPWFSMNFSTSCERSAGESILHFEYDRIEQSHLVHLTSEVCFQSWLKETPTASLQIVLAIKCFGRVSKRFLTPPGVWIPRL